MDFVSLGMLIIDDIYPSALESPLVNVLGGAGTYATVGARLFRPHGDSTKVGYVVHAGSDFPSNVRGEIDSWSSATAIVPTPERLTTRGKNIYRNGLREFEFANPKIQVDEYSLTEDMLCSKTFHIICTPARCMELVKGILAARGRYSKRKVLDDDHEPIFVWEPMEGSCKPDERGSLLAALRYVDVFSPNQDEFMGLFEDQHSDGERFASEKIARFANELLNHGLRTSHSAVVVRMGANGVFIAWSSRSIQLPAYHTPVVKEGKEASNNKVVDVTGGGNAFLGGYCMGLLDRKNKKYFENFEYAAAFGNVAASFAIEQHGIPKLTYGDDESERWNGERVIDRLAQMQKSFADSNASIT